MFQPQKAPVSPDAVEPNKARVCPAWAVGVMMGTFTVLSACDKTKEPANADHKPISTESVGWREWVTKGTDPEWLKSQWSKASELAKAAKASLASINADELKQQCSDLTKAIETRDYTKVEELAGHLDKLLTTEDLLEGMRFVVIQRQKGGEAAEKAIEEYASRKDLSDFEKAAAENLKNGMAFVQRDDVQGYIVLAIFFACECKLGAHQGGLLAVPIISILFPDYDIKHTPTHLKP